ncbi:MAG: DNA gyrase subunit A, partial [Christensenellales bacterium]
AEKREHILAGLMIAVQNIDEVIRLIRISKNANEARKRLMEAFDITSVQAQAILDLRLRRLTALELGELKRDYEQVVKLIARLKGILSSEKKLVGVIEKELWEIKEKYAVPRRTQLCRLETAHASELQVSRQSPAIFSLPKQAILSVFR